MGIEPCDELTPSFESWHTGFCIICHKFEWGGWVFFMLDECYSEKKRLKNEVDWDQRSCSRARRWVLHNLQGFFYNLRSSVAQCRRVSYWQLFFFKFGLPGVSGLPKHWIQLMKVIVFWPDFAGCMKWESARLREFKVVSRIYFFY